MIVYCFLSIKTKTHMKALTSSKNKLAFLSQFFSLQKVPPFYKCFWHFENRKNTRPESFQNGHCKFATHVSMMKFKRGVLAAKVFMCFSIISYYFNFCFWFWKLLGLETFGFFYSPIQEISVPWTTIHKHMLTPDMVLNHLQTNRGTILKCVLNIAPGESSDQGWI